MVTLSPLRTTFTLQGRMFLMPNDMTVYPLGVALQTCRLLTVVRCLAVWRSSVRLRCLILLGLKCRMNPIVLLSVTVFEKPVAFVLNPSGMGVQAAPVNAIALITLLLFRNGGTLLSSVCPLHSMLTFAGVKSPRFENVQKL